jgi:hypothetical protein
MWIKIIHCGIIPLIIHSGGKNRLIGKIKENKYFYGDLVSLFVLIDFNIVFGLRFFFSSKVLKNSYLFFHMKLIFIVFGMKQLTIR